MIKGLCDLSGSSPIKLGYHHVKFGDARHFGIGEMMVLAIFLTLDISECSKSSTPKFRNDLLKSILNVIIYSGYQVS